MTARVAFFIISFVLANGESLWSQCLPRDSLHNILKSPSTRNVSRLTELLGYEKSMSNCTYRDDSTHATLLRLIGLIYYDEAEYSKAVSYTNRSIQIINTHVASPSINYSHLSKCYYNLHCYYDSLNLQALKIQAVDSLISVEKVINTDYYNTCIVIGEKIRYLFNQGDYRRCVQLSDMGETIIRKYYHDTDSLYRLFYALSYKIGSLIFLGDNALAEDLLKRSIDDYTRSGGKEYIGVLHLLMAHIYNSIGFPEKAMASFKKAYDANMKISYKKGCAESLSRIGTLYSEKLNNQLLAVSFLKKALKYADQVDSVYILTNIANAYTRQNKFDSAFDIFQLAFDQIRPGLDEKTLVSMPLTETFSNKITDYITELVINKGDAYLAAARYHKKNIFAIKAIDIYKHADKLLAGIKSVQLEFDSKLFWRTHSRRLYEHAIEACYETGDKETAFYFFEKSRAVLLNDQLNDHRLMTDKDIQQQASLKTELEKLKRRLGLLSPSSKDYLEAQKSIHTNSLARETLVQKIKNNNPRYFRDNLDTSFITVADARNFILKDHEGLVEIYAGDSSVYVLTILRENTTLIRINRDQYERLTKSFIASLSGPLQYKRDLDSLIVYAHQLYQLIFPYTSLPKGRIVISPDGNYFPFEALVKNITGQRYQYFLNDHAVSYTYSARYLLNDAVKNDRQMKGSFMGVAPVNYSGSLRLSALSGSDHSLKSIGAGFNDAKNLFELNANRNNFLDQFYRYNIIHLYTHASANDGMEPVIFFADSALYLNELVINQKPVTQLVVLAACETGLGKFYQGEGVFSFNREFAAIGIPSSIVNLWPVDNKTTYELNELFYKHLSKGAPIDIALQKAKLEYISKVPAEKALPYYWAATVLAGESMPLVPKEGGFFSWISLLIIPFVLILWILFRKLNTRHRKNQDFKNSINHHYKSPRPAS